MTPVELNTVTPRPMFSASRVASCVISAHVSSHRSASLAGEHKVHLMVTRNKTVFVSGTCKRLVSVNMADRTTAPVSSTGESVAATL